MLQIENEAKKIRDKLAIEKDSVKNPIDLDLPVIPPFKGNISIPTPAEYQKRVL